MCKVIESKGVFSPEFILYNHLFSKKDYQFTMQSLQDELKQYSTDFDEYKVKSIVNMYVRQGMIRQDLKGYRVCDY